MVKTNKDVGNLEYLQAIKEDSFKKDMVDYPEKIGHCLEDRKVVALEIIAEELVNNNSTLRTLITTLENIETAINRR